MQKLEIHNLGPIVHCEMNIDDFIVCTGPQASGKSTVAKSIFFFKNLKNLMYEQFNRGYLLKDEKEQNMSSLSFANRFFKEARSNFLQIFGSTWHMSHDMKICYQYKEGTFINVFLRMGADTPNYIWIDCSRDIVEMFCYLEEIQTKHHEHFGPVQDMVKRKIDELFDDDRVVVYIPAGRSLITLLSTQLNYLYSSMDDIQKRSLDYCTQNYLERVLRLKSGFVEDSDQMIFNAISYAEKKLDRHLLTEMAKLKHAVLQGEYLNINGEERLQISEDKYVKINFASSGQQEIMWILNVLFYYVLNGIKAYFIIEEPESHLFPEAQKLVTEYISLAKSARENQFFMTTHSPYILGAVNNLLYADKIASVVPGEKVDEIIPRERWLEFDRMSAYFIRNGKVDSCTDEEFKSIENEVIDGAADAINDAYARMVLLKEKYTDREEDE